MNNVLVNVAVSLDSSVAVVSTNNGIFTVDCYDIYDLTENLMEILVLVATRFPLGTNFDLGISYF